MTIKRNQEEKLQRGASSSSTKQCVVCLAMNVEQPSGLAEEEHRQGAMRAAKADVSRNSGNQGAESPLSIIPPPEPSHMDIEGDVIPSQPSRRLLVPTMLVEDYCRDSGKEEAPSEMNGSVHEPEYSLSTSLYLNNDNSMDVEVEEEEESAPLPAGVSDVSANALGSEEAKEALLGIDAHLEGLIPVGETNEQRRVELDQDALVQRNLEIQSELLWIDMEYERVLDSDDWEIRMAALDDRADELATESDAIEAILDTKFNVIGAGYVKLCFIHRLWVWARYGLSLLLYFLFIVSAVAKVCWKKKKKRKKKEKK